MPAEQAEEEVRLASLPMPLMLDSVEACKKDTSWAKRAAGCAALSAHPAVCGGLEHRGRADVVTSAQVGRVLRILEQRLEDGHYRVVQTALRAVPDVLGAQKVEEVLQADQLQWVLPRVFGRLGRRCGHAVVGEPARAVGAGAGRW